MAKIIENLIELQAKDNELDSFAARVEAIPAETEDIKNRVEALSTGLTEKENEYKSKAVAQQGIENDVRQLNEEIKKSQSELYAVKTNDMYTTILEGIKDKKNKVSDAETSLLKLMDDIEAARKILDEEKGKVSKQIAEMDSRSRELSAEKDNLSEEITRKKVVRGESVENMRSDKDMAKALERYERIRKSKGGVAIVRVGDGNVCGGCNMSLTKQQIIEVSSADLVLCENCGRILCV